MTRSITTWPPAAAQDIHLDLDAHLNKIIPPSPLWRLPRPISHFLGYREKPRPDVGNVLIALFALLGTFVGLLSVSAVGRYSSWIAERHPPVLLASLGAAAVLEYNTMLSPLAQPRNSIFGHTLAAFIGICFAKLMLLSTDRPDTLAWILAPLACGTASAVMTLLNSIYPPGGATAILAVADPTVRALGWHLILFVLVFSLLMLACACVTNNIVRRYPIFWWSPLECGQVYSSARRSGHGQGRARHGNGSFVDDIEKLSPTQREFVSEESLAASHLQCPAAAAAAVTNHTAGLASAVEPARVAASENLAGAAFEESIVLSANGMLNVPHNIQLAEYERAVLHGLLVKLQAPNYGRAATEKSWSEVGSEPG